MVQLYLFMQILLESLPISSSGHLHLLGLEVPWPIDFFAHGPTVIMMLIYFARPWGSLIAQSLQNPYLIIRGVGAVGVAEIITILFFLLKRFNFCVIPLAFGFFCTASALWSLRWLPIKQRTQAAIRVSDGLWVGLAQGVALLVPGVSRLALTYVVGRWIGMSAQGAFYFSSLVQIPLFFGAALLGTSLLWKTGQLSMIVANGGWFSLVIASIGAYFLLWIVEQMMRRDVVGYIGLYMLFPTIYALFLK